jgi:8-oxo-dGTP pyrophosphatase MutT (NUDIX family)
VNLREGVRALILDENDSVLLVRFDWDGLDLARGFWANPGGGIEVGESRHDALARELLEEVGLRMRDLGPEIWTKTAVFPMATWDGQVDHIHLQRVEHFDPQPRLTADELMAENIHEVRWWTVGELLTTHATFAPRALPTLIDDLLSSAIPDDPLVITGF